ncbi:DJ-1/PfpI family protein [Phenylobacterium sp.]|uniref:DJ-1/PfpI family protein n=1 Tax=Phenylobacterium sp. TaxID=1871053 RepID=UPI0035AE6760
MNVAVLTFEAFNELDSFVVAALLNRLSEEGVRAYITAPTETVVSKNGVAVQAQKPLEFANEADAVVIGSGMKSAEVAADPKIRAVLKLDPARQLIASQCSGAFLLAALRLVEPGRPICTDLASAPAIKALGFTTPGKPFHAEGDVASAGGCLSSQYLATWIAARALGLEAAERMIWGAAPVGEKDAWVERALSAVRPFLRLSAAA